MTQVTINGHTYSDDGTAAKDMLNGGHRTHFFPLVQDVVTVAGQVATNAASASADAASAAAVATAMRGTSTTSLTVGTGSQTLTTQASKQFSVGNYLTISRTSSPTTLMHGVVTAYNSGTGSLTVSVTTIAGSGTFTDWTIAVSGAKGDTGASGNGQIAYLAKTGAYTVTASDKAKLIDCTSGTFTLSFQACASLGADWVTFIRNSGTGTITLDPNASETIDGAATITLPPGTDCAVQCDGTSLRTFARSIRSNYVHVRDSKASGTNGGSSAAGSQTRTLNTVMTNTMLGASLASNAVTLPPGTYYVRARAPAYDAGLQKLIVYDATGAANLLVGPTAEASASGFVQTDAVAYGRFTLTATSDVRLSHYTQSVRASDGLGKAVSDGTAEVYAEMEIWRVVP